MSGKRLSKESVIMIKSLTSNRSDTIFFNDRTGQYKAYFEVNNEKIYLKSGAGLWTFEDPEKAIRSIRRHNKNVPIFY